MEETVLYQHHPAMFRNNPIGFILSFILCFLGIGLVILLVWRLKTLGTSLTVSNKRITLRQGLLSKNINEVYTVDVRNVQIKQNLFQRIFRVGSIDISSAGQGTIEISVKGVPNPEKIKNIIDQYR
ncbi:MAG: PH domain-containing protein [Pontiellaceae bacterium]|nr:PH domain-containing protein [Pontiellaceae bacterium]